MPYRPVCQPRHKSSSPPISKTPKQTAGFPAGTGTTLSASTNQANTGSYSLLTTGRTQSFGGPSIDLSSSLTRGQLYIFTIYVRMAEGEANDSIKMTMQSTINGSNTFNTVSGPQA